MSRPVVVLRPEPGNQATIAMLIAAGLEGIALPLFSVAPLAWELPDASRFDGLLLTSANSVRHGGPRLSALRSLPVLAVGDATAAAARSAGFDVERIGESDVADLLGTAAGRRLLWLTGADRTAIQHPAIAEIVPVYEAAALAIATRAIAGLRGGVALLHSTRAARHFAQAVDNAAAPRESLRLVAISAKVAVAAGTGWADLRIARAPNDAAMIAAARAVAIDP